MTDARNEYISKVKENLDLLNARIVELEAKANEKTGEVRRELKAELGGIRESKGQAERRLDDPTNAGRHTRQRGRACG